MSRLFYKFLVLSNPYKFTKMKLVDDEDVETIIALFCSIRNVNAESIELFAELADMEPVENVSPLSQHMEFKTQQCGYGATSTRAKILHRILTAYNNINSGPYLQIHLVVIETNVDGEKGPNNDGHSDHEGEDFSDPDLDEVLDDIENEGVDNIENVYDPSVKNPTRGIFICNDSRAHMLSLDPDMAYASEFPKYLDIIPSHRLAVDFESKELFARQQFTNKEDCVFSIK
ncbi:hypothetical protein PVK06_008281 [Gossypium arboreum]|uniref:Uncharacterized protein n=1 Tax=Gossypium arboreum TaxID=29729 RepID=A0ABR0QJK7_GOSAR|nr:hypothetical protein PVK06_008281 [Gossypium arboreum]